MKRQNLFPFFSSLILFSLFSEAAYALPKGTETIAGVAITTQVDAKTVHVETSDKAIINYKQFDIGKGEKVKFIQPSSHSSVLNRVSGKKVSEILGSLESNGKVFLVNPNGIYFGPESTVNVGSLIASTLDIENQDFLEGKYKFTLDRNNSSVICNEGSLEGSIVLLAPFVKNLGVIEAKAGTVILASGQHVTLDFTGDGLISFAVEGVIKDSLIENFGKIRAQEGSVSLKLATAKKAISEIVNHDGIEEGAAFIEEGGKIFFASESEILARQVLVEGGDLTVSGQVVAEEVHVLGKDISLIGATIDASRVFGGGEVFVGGEFQGKGTTPYASTVVMDVTSKILASALEEGDGGLVVLWSKDRTIFDGTIEAKGSLMGGLVETSSLGDLGSQTGHVDTSSLRGINGTWLLDPTILVVDAVSPTCTIPYCSDLSVTCYVALSTVTGAASNVVLSAVSEIDLMQSISMTNSGIGLTFSACTASPITVKVYGNIVTKGGSIAFTNATFLYEGSTDCLIDTTNSGVVPAGAAINLGSSLLSSTSQNLTVNAGTGGVLTLGSFDEVNHPFRNLTVTNAGSVTSAAISVLGNVSITSTGAFTIPSITTASLGSTVTLDSGSPIAIHAITTNAGLIHVISAISLALATVYDSTGGGITLDSTVDGTRNFTLNGGATGTIGLSGIVGGTTPLSAFTISNALNVNTVAITASSITQLAGSGTSTFGGLLTTTGSTGVNLTGNAFAVNSVTTTGGGGLTIANTGAISLGTLSLDNALIQTGGTSFLASLSGNIAATSISFAMPILLTGASLWTTTLTNGVTFPSLNMQSFSLGLTAGSTNDITLGAITGSGDLTITSVRDLTTGSITANSVTATVTGNTVLGGAVNLVSGIIISTHDLTTRSIIANSLTATVTGNTNLNGVINLTSSTSLSGIGLTLGGRFTSAGDLTIANTGVLTLSPGIVISLGGSFNQSGLTPVKVLGTINAATGITFGSSVTLIGTSTWNTSAGNGTITVPSISGTYSSIINAGTGIVNLNGAVGATELQSFQVTAGTINQTSTVHAHENIIYTASTVINVGGNLTSDSGTIDWDGVGDAILGTGPMVFTATAGDVLISSNTITGPYELTLSSKAGGSVTFNKAGTSGFPLTSFTVLNATSVSSNGIVTNGGAISIPTNSTLTLTGATTFDTTDGGLVPVGAAITLGSIEGAYALTLEAGSSSITFNSVGASTALLSLVATGNSITQNGSVRTTRVIDYTASSISLNGDLTASSGDINWIGPVTLTNNVVATSGVDILATSTISGTYDLTLTAASGSVTVDDAITVNAFTLSSLHDSYIEDVGTSGPVLITVTAGSLILSSNTEIVTTDGSITVGDVDGTSIGGQSLTLNAGNGNSPVVMGIIGGHVALSSLIVTGSSITQNGSVTVTGEIEYNTAGTIDIESDITTSGSITWTGPVVLSNSVIITSTAGDITAESSIDGADFDLTLIATLGTVTVDGAIGSSSSRLGVVSIDGLSATINSIYTDGFLIEITPPVTLNADAVLDSGGGDITLSSTVDGAFNLTLNGGVYGDISVGIIGGITPPTSVTILGDQTFYSNSIKAGLGGIAIHPPVVLNASVVFNTTSPVLGGDIHLFSTLDANAPGNANIALRAGTGNVSLDGAVGGNVRVGIFAIISANNVVTNSISATTIIQETGFGNSSFGDALHTEGFSGVRVQGNNFTFEGPVDASGTGVVSITNRGALVVNSAADMSIAGSFLQKGGGTVATAGDITMTGVGASTIIFTNPVVLTGDVTWDTTLGNGNVLLRDTLDGPGGLTVEVGTGDLAFQGNVGSNSALGSLDVSGNTTLLSGSILSTLGSQTYNSLLKIAQSIVFSNQVGNIAVNEFFDGFLNGYAAVFSMGGGALTFAQPVGSIEPLTSLIAYNTGSFSAEAIDAGFLRVSGGMSEIDLNGPVTLTGALGIFLDGGPIYLGGSIDAEKVFFRSYGSILNMDTPLAINVPGVAQIGFEYMNAVHGTIGTASDPIEINTAKTIVLGANPSATLIGTPFHNHFGYVTGNVPCLVTFNEVIIRNCKTIPSIPTLFDSIPKYYFYLPGIYSSWDNLSNLEYFLGGAAYPAENPRDRTLFWIKPTRKKSTLKLK